MFKILIADDKEENRIMLSNFFRLVIDENDLNFSYASTADEAYELAVKNIPDLIMLDIKMDREDAGIIASKRIKANQLLKDIPIWAVTAYPVSSDEEKSTYFEAGFSNYIAKPFDPVLLIKNIKQTLNITIPDEIKTRMGL